MDDDKEIPFKFIRFLQLRLSDSMRTARERQKEIESLQNENSELKKDLALLKDLEEKLKSIK